MDLYLFKPTKFESLYNCTPWLERGQREVPLETRQHIWLGLTFLLLGLTMELLYIPCIGAIWKHREQACYKFMLYMGITDMLCLLVNACLTGVMCMIGAVFCSWPNVIWLGGVTGLVLWCSESTCEVLLAVNRCVEICSEKWADSLFKGWRTFLWLLIPTAYGVYIAVYTPPVLFSGIYASWFFNPHVGYQDDFGLIYHNIYHTIHNYFVIVALSSTYAMFCALLLYKMCRYKSSAQRSYSQKMTFLQVLLIGLINGIAASIYVSMQFARISELLIISAQMLWIMAHGIPPVIYIFLNRTLRQDCKLFLWRMVRPLLKDVVHSTAHSTAAIHPFRVRQTTKNGNWVGTEGTVLSATNGQSKRQQSGGRGGMTTTETAEKEQAAIAVVSNDKERMFY